MAPCAGRPYNHLMEDIQSRDLIATIKADLIAAMKAKEALDVSALRSLLARISNAEAVPAAQTTIETTSRIAGAGSGVGSTEAPRKQLSITEIREIIQDEIQEMQAARQQLDESSAYAVELSHKTDILLKYR